MTFIPKHQQRLMKTIQTAFAFQMKLRVMADNQPDKYKQRLLNIEIFESAKYLRRLDAALTANIILPEPDEDEHRCNPVTYKFNKS